MKKTIGYENVNVGDIKDLYKLNKEKGVIELLTGSCGTGKTTLMREYFKTTSDKCAYISNILHDSDYGRINLIRLEKYKNVDLEKSLNSKLKEFNTVSIYIEESTNNKKYIEEVMKYCVDNKVELLLDVTDTSYIPELLINLKENIELTIITFNAKRLIEQTLKDTDFYSFIKTETNFQKINRLKEINNHSGDVSLRLPKTLHYDLKKEAEREGVSLNQYLLYIISSR